MAWDYLVDAYLPVVVADSAPPPLPYDAGTCSGTSAPAPACVSALAYCLAPLPAGATVRELSVLVPSTVTVTGGYAPGGLCPAAFELRAGCPDGPAISGCSAGAGVVSADVEPGRYFIAQAGGFTPLALAVVPR